MRPLAPLSALVLLGCAQPAARPKPAPPPRPVSSDVAAWVAEVSGDAEKEERTTRLAEAEGRYLTGDNAEGSDLGRSAYRAVCHEHAVEREMTLDELRAHGQAHAVASREWYARHCASLRPKLGAQIVVERESGKVLSAPDASDEGLALCVADAGSPPARMYERSEAETVAQARRDACERAQ